MNTIPKSVGMAEFRRQMPSYLNKANHEPVVLSRGNSQYVVVSLEGYNALFEGQQESEKEKRRKERKNFLDNLERYVEKNGPIKIERKGMEFELRDLNW